MGRLLFLLMAVALFSFAQQVDPSATRAIDGVLQGARIIELPEGKKLVEQNTWGDLDLPIFSGATTIFESEFDTDAASIRGVKRLVELVGSGDSSGLLLASGKRLRDIDEKYGSDVEPLRPATQRFLVVAYQDTVTRTWKAISITSKTDTAAEVDNTRDFNKLDKFSILGARPSLKRYWFAMAVISGQVRPETGGGSVDLTGSPTANRNCQG